MHQFKVGDRVRLKADQLAYAVAHNIQGVQVIASIDDRFVTFEGGKNAYTFRLEPAPALIDPAKAYQTREGCAVRIYAVDGGGEEPVHGAYQKDGVWFGTTWLADGMYYGGVAEPRDLIEVKPERDGWVNVYANLEYPSASILHATKTEADESATEGRTSCLHLKFREGDGL